MSARPWLLTDGPCSRPVHRAGCTPAGRRGAGACLDPRPRRRREALHRYRIGGVIHLAGKQAVVDSFDQPALYHRENAVGRRAGDPPAVVARVTAIQRALGWRAECDLAAMVPSAGGELVLRPAAAVIGAGYGTETTGRVGDPALSAAAPAKRAVTAGGSGRRFIPGR